METTPGWCGNWYVSEDYIKEALKQLDNHGVELETVFVVPSLSKNGYYLITWKNHDKERM